MENGQSANTSELQGDFIMEIDNEGEEGHGDIMARRVKNRERQRRYRARKRLEADSIRSIIVSTHPTTPEVLDPEPIAIARDWNPRVHSRRDWKKDARMAHDLKTDSEVFSPNGIVNTGLTITSGAKSELQSEGESRPETSSEIVNYAPNGTTAGLRYWKSEARKRKS